MDRRRDALLEVVAPCSSTMSVVAAPQQRVDPAADQVAIYKPAGLSSERGPGDPGDSVVVRASAQFGWEQCWLPHRLDRPTRGIMMLAGSKTAAARQGAEVRAGAWTKWYTARICGSDAAVAALVGEHRTYLKREGRLARVVRSGGDPARLTILAVAPATDAAGEHHALIRLGTGRFHQIRVMLAHLGHPLVGDVDYGGAPRPARAPREFAEIDLESIALRIDREAHSQVFRLTTHPDRRGLSPRIDAALAAAVVSDAR